jgi:predicted nucleic acid-binding protein
LTVPPVTPSITSCYLDTSLLSAAIVNHSAHHAAAAAFCEQLITSGTTVVISELVYLEYANFLRTLVGQLAPGVARAHGLHRWERQPQVRLNWIEVGAGQFETFMRRFAAVEGIALTQPTIIAARRMMAVCNLASYDSVHVVTALSAGVSHLAAVDDHFARARDLLDVIIVR